MTRRVLLLLVPFAAACTLLVHFVDTPDASLDATSSDATFDASADGSTDAGVDVYDAAKLCKGLGDGWYCGLNGLNGTPPAEWLVHCVDASAVVRVCDGGCLAFPSGVADRCNECPGMPDGVYCGSQFATWGTDNAPYLISCEQGYAVIQMKCVIGCQPGPGDASCK